MIHRDDSVFFPPIKNYTIWRYMDFSKLMSFLETGELYFRRSDKFDDPYEGALTKPSVRMFREQAAVKGIPSERINMMIDSFQQMRTEIYLNCWCMSEHESAAMWSVYLQAAEGVAIKTDYDTLESELNASKYKVATTMIQYIDYNKLIIPLSNLYFPFLFKRHSFSHEKELRTILWSRVDVNRDLIKHEPISIGVKVDKKVLLREVYVAPRAPAWFGDLVERVLKSYGVSSVVERSPLYDRPQY